jgi:hypothetical protein
MLAPEGLRARAVLNRAILPRKAARAVDERHVREGLREVADETLAVDIVLFREKANVVPYGEEPLEELDRLGSPAAQHERVDQPE